MLKQIINALGRTHVENEVKELLNLVSYRKPLKLPKGESSVYVEAPDFGIVLLFEDAALIRPDDISVPEGALVLEAVFLYSSAVAGYQTYAGDLPFGLSFSDTRQISNEKIKAPEIWSEEFLSSSWDKDGLTAIADYLPDMQGLKQMQVSKSSQS